MPWVRAPAIASKDQSHPVSDRSIGLLMLRMLPALTLGGGRTMSGAHDPSLREGHRGDASRGLDWLIISGPISEEFALRIASLCFSGPQVDHGDGPTCYTRRPAIELRTRRRTLVIQRHGESEDDSARGTP
jgi:hypothetical protein